LQRWSVKTDSAALEARKKLRIGIPENTEHVVDAPVLDAVPASAGIEARYITWSSDSSEEQARQFAKGPRHRRLLLPGQVRLWPLR
jgi:hypothetical protein